MIGRHEKSLARMSGEAALFSVAEHKLVIGMVHLSPLPGTPFHVEGSLSQIRAKAVQDASVLMEGGADGCLVQTVDRVYPIQGSCDEARLSAMSLIVSDVVAATGGRFRVGVQIMRNSLRASIAVAKVAEAHFIRATCFIGSTHSPAGIIAADPLDVTAYRRSLNAEDIAIVADVDTQHFRWAGPPVSLPRICKYAIDAGADAVAIADPSAADINEKCIAVRELLPSAPIVIAGHTSHRNASEALQNANAVFVGSCIEHSGWGGHIDVDLVRSYIDVIRG